MHLVIKILQKIFNETVFLTSKIRAEFWRLFCKKMGKNVYIMRGCYIMDPSHIEIGDNVTINRNTTISGQGGLTIGNNVMIAPNCTVITSNHEYRKKEIPMMFQGENRQPTVIKNDVWLGANVVVLPGVTIEKGSIIGANAVVSKNVEAYSIVGGVPAKFIKYRFSPEEIEKIKEIV
ncbi:MAG: acyltransferase [Candidatus Moraniibacteriota bacterium]